MELDHLTVFVRNYSTSKPFYEEALAPLGSSCSSTGPTNIAPIRPARQTELAVARRVRACRKVGARSHCRRRGCGARFLRHRDRVRSAVGLGAWSAARVQRRLLLRAGVRLRRQFARGSLPRRGGDSRPGSPRRRVTSLPRARAGRDDPVRRAPRNRGVGRRAGGSARRDGLGAQKCTAAGVLHGGALMAFADTLGGVSAFLNLPDGGGTMATVESRRTSSAPCARGGWRA